VTYLRLLLVLALLSAAAGCTAGPGTGGKPAAEETAAATTVATTLPAVHPNELIVAALRDPANITLLERAIHDRINRERNNWSRHNLLFDKNLATISRSHSADMAVNAYLSTRDAKDRGPSLRARESGYDCIRRNGSKETIGLKESVFRINLLPGDRKPDYPAEWRSLDDIATYIVADSLSRKNSSEIMLYDLGQYVGIGAALSPDGSRLYVTEDVC
jgi:hypothetical protein